MADLNPDQPSDDLWKQFDAAEIKSNEWLEEQYQEIERRNALILNDVTGIEDSPLEIRGRIGGPPGELIDPPKGSLKYSSSSLLFLRPDRKDEYITQGESSGYAELYGDPYVIRGEVPPRTQKLIDDLFASTEAHKDDERSSPNHEVWAGNVAGSAIEFDVRISESTTSDGKQEKLPALTIHAVRPVESLSSQIGRTATDALTSSHISLVSDKDMTTGEIGAADTSGYSTELAPGVRVEKIPGRKLFRRVRGKIFPTRNKY